MKRFTLWVVTSLLLAVAAEARGQEAELAVSTVAEPPRVEAPAAGVAADLVQRILAGEDDESSWHALTTALDGDDAPVGTPATFGGSPASAAGEGGSTTTLSAWIAATRAGLVDEPASAESLTVYLILLLVGVALASIVIGLGRRTLRGRSARDRRTRGRRAVRTRRPVRGGRRSRRRRGSRVVVCRDAERLQAHVRVHRAA